MSTIRLRKAGTAALVTCFLAMFAVGVQPAVADWLVLSDGQRLQTRGSWTVEEGRVIYTSASGVLSALRLDLVDLDASAKANLPVVREAPTTQRKAAVVISQSDVGQVSPDTRTVDTAEETPAAEGPQALTIGEWQEVEFDAGTRIRGVVSNTDSRSHIGAKLDVFLDDVTGELIDTATASLGTRNLQAGETTTFVASFPNVFAYGDVRFELDSVPLRASSSAEADASTDTDSSSATPSSPTSPSDESSVEEMQR